MDWLLRNRLVALSFLLGAGCAGLALLSRPQPAYWLPAALFLLPLLFGIHAQSALRTARQADHARRSAEQLPAAAVFEATDQGIMITDREHCIVAVNPAFIRLTGYTQDEVTGKTPLQLKSRRHNEAFYENIWRSLERKGSWEGEIWSRRKNGDLFPSWHTISPIYDRDTGKLSHYLSVFTDITPIKRQQANMDLLAYHDPLTGLPNRLLFTERLQHALNVLTRINGHVALLFFDLDGFKSINDTLGHTVGDALLQAVAERMQSTLREGDTVARFGGDEFVILTESCDSRSGLERVAEKVIREIERPLQINDQTIVVRASVGIATAPEDGTDSQALIEAADKAMYRAKVHEGSHFCFHTGPEVATPASKY